MSKFRKIRAWMGRHKIMTGALGFVLVLVFIFGWTLISATGGFSRIGLLSPSYQESAPTQGMRGAEPAAGDLASPGGAKPLESGAIHRGDGGDTSGITKLQVQEGTVTVESDNANNDADRVRSLVQNYDGHIEQSQKRESNTQLRVELTARVPVDRFDTFFSQLRDTLDVQNYNVRNFRIAIERQLDQRTILNNALQDYEQMREEVREMSVSQEKIQLLKSIADKELTLQEKLQETSRQLAESRQESDLATVEVTFIQDLRAEIWPEDLGNRFVDNLRKSIDTVASTLIDIVTGGLTLIFSVIKWIIFGVIVIVPVVFVYRVLRRWYLRMFR